MRWSSHDILIFSSIYLFYSSEAGHHFTELQWASVSFRKLTPTILTWIKSCTSFKMVMCTVLVNSGSLVVFIVAYIIVNMTFIWITTLSQQYHWWTRYSNYSYDSYGVVIIRSYYGLYLSLQAKAIIVVVNYCISSLCISMNLSIYIFGYTPIHKG